MLSVSCQSGFPFCHYVILFVTTLTQIQYDKLNYVHFIFTTISIFPSLKFYLLKIVELAFNDLSGVGVDSKVWIGNLLKMTSKDKPIV